MSYESLFKKVKIDPVNFTQLTFTCSRSTKETEEKVTSFRCFYC